MLLLLLKLELANQLRDRLKKACEVCSKATVISKAYFNRFCIVDNFIRRETVHSVKFSGFVDGFLFQPSMDAVVLFYIDFAFDDLTLLNLN